MKIDVHYTGTMSYGNEFPARQYTVTVKPVETPSHEYQSGVLVNFKFEPPRPARSTGDVYGGDIMILQREAIAVATAMLFCCHQGGQREERHIKIDLNECNSTNAPSNDNELVDELAQILTREVQAFCDSRKKSGAGENCLPDESF